STSLSPGSFVPLAQLVGTQRPVQLPLWQSTARAQLLPSTHLGQLPPQSTSLSLPFFTPSLQVGAAQCARQHTPLWQSSSTAQLAPVAQAAQTPPPQST